jgi:hypothetical protein
MYSIAICRGIALRCCVGAALVFGGALTWVGRSLVNHVVLSLLKTVYFTLLKSKYFQYIRDLVRKRVYVLIKETSSLLLLTYSTGWLSPRVGRHFKNTPKSQIFAP